MKRSPQDSAAAEYIDAVHLPERRAHLRHQPRSIVYVELDEGNGGIALNLSEDGLAVQSVMPLMDDFLARLRFQLSESKEWIETSAQVVWTNESRKLVGLRFMGLPEVSRGLIREWLEREDLPNKEADGPQILSEGLEGRAAPPRPWRWRPYPIAMYRRTPGDGRPRLDVFRGTGGNSSRRLRPTRILRRNPHRSVAPVPVAKADGETTGAEHPRTR